MPMASVKEKQGEEARIKIEEIEGSSLFGGQCVPDKSGQRKGLLGTRLA